MMNKSGITPMHSGTADSTASERGLLKRIGFYALNLAIMFHLVAICAAPLSVSPSSELEQSLWDFTAPYVQLLYQNNGFHYFAPNPEGAHTVHYVVTYKDGKTERGLFPHRGIWPRLLYHRHLMLSENLAAMEGERRERMARDFAYQVCKSHGAERVTLSLVRHDIAMRERIIAGGSLFDEDLYQEIPLGTFTWADLSATSSVNSVATATK